MAEPIHKTVVANDFGGLSFKLLKRGMTRPICLVKLAYRMTIGFSHCFHFTQLSCNNVPLLFYDAEFYDAEYTLKDNAISFPRKLMASLNPKVRLRWPKQVPRHSFSVQYLQSIASSPIFVSGKSQSFPTRTL